MVSKTSFDGVTAWEMSSGRFGAKVMEYGATLIEFTVDGRNIVLGYADAKGYEEGTSFIGACVGRYANRIGGAAFTLDGKEYRLNANENGNQLHGGVEGGLWSKRIWTSEQTGENSVRFTLASPDGDNGFPGNMLASATYTIKEEGMEILFEGETDAPTVYAPTTHTYFNLSGFNPEKPLECATDSLGHELMLNSASYLEPGPGLIPTGRILPCEGDFDFSAKKKVGVEFDHCFLLDGTAEKFFACSLSAGGITMEIRTDCPALQVYTGGCLEPHFGKDRGIALEPEFYPDTPNRPEFPSCLLRPGEHFRKSVSYRFV